MAKRHQPKYSPTCANCSKRSTSKLFCTLTTEELNRVSINKGYRAYKKGEIIFHEGSRGHGLFCIYSGKVKVHKLGHDAKEQIVRLAAEGDVLGYRSLLADEPYNATATALEGCTICYIPKNQFLLLLKNNNELSYKTIQLLSDDLKRSEESVINISQKTVIEKIAEALLILKRKFGLKKDGVTLNVSLTRREIGEMVNVTTESTIRTLSKLNRNKVISLKGKDIQLINISRLLRLARTKD